MQLLMTKGLSGSGKSTFAKKLVSGDIRDMGSNWKRVNKDDLRAMIDNGYWSKANEREIIAVRDTLIMRWLSFGFNVIVDDTNLAPKHEEQLRQLAKHYNATFVIKDFTDVPLETCIKRDLLRLNSVGKDVIMQQYNQFLAPKPAIYTPPEGKPKCIIVDIDGTLAHMIPQDQGGRSPYDWYRVNEDILDPVVAKLVDQYQHTVILLSGRDGGCRDVTEEWLKQKNVFYHELFMRTANDNRKDNIVKRELFDAHVRDNYQVEYVLDDRDQVVKMWRNELGLKVLQVAYGDF